MKIVTQFLIILVFSFIGELLRYLIPLPIPASIYGLLLLFLALKKKWVKVDSIRAFRTNIGCGFPSQPYRIRYILV